MMTIYNAHGGYAKRGICLKNDISAFKTLICFKPLVKIINSTVQNNSGYSLETACSSCFHKFSSSQDSITCPNCSLTKYCGQDCLLKDCRATHKYECDILRSFLKKAPKEINIGEFIRLVIQLFVTCEQYPTYKREIFNLTSHKEEFIKGIHADFLYDNLDLVVNSVHECNPRRTKDELKSYINDLICICFVNANILMDEYGEAIGMGIDPYFSLINHSCIPNTTVIPYSSTSFQLVTNCAIQKAKEITINYCYTSNPKELRQLDLANRFFFTCKCGLCTAKVDYFFSYNCLRCNALICSLSFDNFFNEDSADTLVFKCLNKTCGNCRIPIDLDQVKKTNSLHKLILAYFIYSFFSRNTVMPELRTDSFDNFVKGLNGFVKEAGLLNIDSKSLVNYLSLIPNGSLEIQDAHFTYISLIFSNLLDFKIIPEYCFPLNQFLPVLASCIEHKTFDNKMKVDLILTRLKYEVKSTINADLAVDLTEQITSKFSQYASLTITFLDIYEQLAQVPDDEWVSNLWNEGKDEILTVLLKSTFFFSIQALEFFESKFPMQTHLMMQVIDYVEAILKSGFSTSRLKEWYSQKPADFTADTFHDELTKLFNFVGGCYSFKQKVIKYQFADRMRKHIFTPVANLNCLKKNRFR